MKMTVLYTDNNNLSYFRDEEIDTPIEHPLGKYSLPFQSDGVQFREFDANLVYPMHNAPREQYIVYLRGSVKVFASGGETRIFTAGDILLAKDLSGKGHESITIEPGIAVVIPMISS